MIVRTAETAAEIAACFPVMRLLRPHLLTEADLIERVRRQTAAGYRLLAAWLDATVAGVAGYRMQENLVRGRFCYVDDMVVAESQRRNGVGARLLDAIADHARVAGMAWLTLDTGLDNHLGQRFYRRYGMLPASYDLERYSRASPYAAMNSDHFWIM